jgi:hypothetical protein
MEKALNLLKARLSEMEGVTEEELIDANAGILEGIVGLLKAGEAILALRETRAATAAAAAAEETEETEKVKLAARIRALAPEKQRTILEILTSKGLEPEMVEGTLVIPTDRIDEETWEILKKEYAKVRTLTKAEYNHPRWPSPRAATVARRLGFKGRNHRNALVFLAHRARLSAEEFLAMSPGEYYRKYTYFRCPSSY